MVMRIVIMATTWQHDNDNGTANDDVNDKFGKHKYIDSGMVS